MKRERKGLKEFTLDPNKAGHGRVVFATFNVIDKDGDVTLPGAFKVGQPVRLAQWGHNWSGPTIGAGVVGADTVKAWADIEFNLEMAAGKETYQSIKFDAARFKLQEYSYGYDVVDAELGQFEGQSVRFLKAQDVIEVSPVMLGAGIGTHTDFLKSAGLPFADHAGHVLASVQALFERTQDLKDLRSKEGRTLSGANRTRLSGLADAMETGLADLRALLADTDPAKPDEPKAQAATLTSLRLLQLADEARALGIAV